ncbi:hypothetical protein PFNF54_05596 [Plasmodium falciparum NF54]|uniref:Uncharacterized protein n=1 Tax=Plasmodium falciparum (isolate NF54) TaxID=5843 RepID=W7K888_PLAFO|nr:hypothetical protein PFNF54_05596 [Plasmodium falciparum NF54]
MKNQFLKEYKGTSFIFLYYILNKHVMKEKKEDFYYFPPNCRPLFFFFFKLTCINKNMSQK